jgi:predicted DCC family thiol-disulfide oxidoreductase YuxK
MKNNSNGKKPASWILYDDSCGVCRRWVPFWEKSLCRRGFEISPLQADWVPAKLQKGETELLSDLRLLLADGSQICGADVYRYAMRRIWWTWPVYLFSITPGLRKVFNLGYRKLAANRYRISPACNLDNKDGSRRNI